MKYHKDFEEAVKRINYKEKEKCEIMLSMVHEEGKIMRALEET